MPPSSRQPDDSHKYPLRSGGGAGLSSAAPPFLAAAAAVDGDNDAANGAVEVGSGGEVNGKLKGYEGHMAALGKLGAGSPSARLFPTPGKKLLKAVGQAIQVRADSLARWLGGWVFVFARFFFVFGAFPAYSVPWMGGTYCCAFCCAVLYVWCGSRARPCVGVSVELSLDVQYVTMRGGLGGANGKDTQRDRRGREGR